MARIEVIDLLSSEDESPSKLLQSFKSRPKKDKSQNSQHGYTISITSSDAEERRNEVGDGTNAPDRLAPPPSRATSVQMREHVSPTGFKSFSLYKQSANLAREEDAKGRDKTQSFTQPILSNDAWKALGSPGRKLQEDFARIRRDLEQSKIQLEAKRQERVQKADLYQQHRRISASKAGTTSDYAARTSTTPSSRPERDSLLTHVLAQQPVDSSVQSKHATGGSQSSDTQYGSRASGFEDRTDGCVKRPFEGPSREVVKRFKTMDYRMETLRRRTQTVDATDPKMERLTTSSEPDFAQCNSANTTQRAPQQNLPSSSPPAATSMASNSQSGRPWTVQEEMLLKRLKEVEGLSWAEIEHHFPGRTKGTLNVRYYTKVKGKRFPARPVEPARLRTHAGPASSANIQQRCPSLGASQSQSLTVQRAATSVKLNDGGQSYSDSDSTTQTPTSSGSKRSWQPFTAQDNALLKKMKAVMNMSWAEIHPYFPQRSLPSLQVHYSTKVKNMKINTSDVVVPAQSSAVVPQAQPASTNASSPHMQSASTSALSSVAKASNFGSQYTAEEVALLKQLKEEVGLDWKAMVPYFNGRTAGSLQVYWYTKIRNAGTARHAPDLQRHDSTDLLAPRAKRMRKSAPAVVDGFVSWTDARAIMRNSGDAEDIEDVGDAADDRSSTASHSPLALQDSVFPRTVNRILHQREIGTGSRTWTTARFSIPEELKNHVHKDYHLRKYYHGTSGDVVGLSWSSAGAYFAAGSIAITDNRSMQYNMSRNLLVGNHEHGELQELVEHHVERPEVTEADNPNALSAMRQTQDSRLFQTVTATAFSPIAEEGTLFTTGTDKMLRKYTVTSDVRSTRVAASFQHKASVELLAVHQEGFIATGAHSASDSITVFDPHGESIDCAWTVSPRRQDLQTTVSIYPSTLKWDTAHVHRNYLLAGFSGDEDKLLAGETALWDVQHQTQIELRGETRNVFDVCWNPRPSPASIVFAVASNSTGIKLGGRGARSAVSCFAPTQPLSAVITWQCPALDINDVLICPYDDNLIAAGATDGKVYVWDQRWAGRSQAPLHVLFHGDSLNILPHGYDRELTDTGVRFLSWGATSSRLYSGSSDGTVKVWNPYRSADNAYVQDLDTPRQHRSAIMSGVFSPDHRELLIGTENGRINLFTTGGAVLRKPDQFTLHTAPEPAAEDSPLEAAEMLLNLGKIVTRPCGAMPISQAVQGEMYDGPFQAPKQFDIIEAERNLQEALTAQGKLAARSARQNDIDQHEAALKKAQMRVHDAQATIEDLWDRLQFAASSRPKAEAFQRELAKSRGERRNIEILAQICFGDESNACQHDCSYLPTSDELEDNGRSDLRIPGALRSSGNEALAVSRVKAEDDASESCCGCFPFQARPKGAKRELCLTCKLNGMRLTTKCSKCSAPARVETDQAKQPVCEACSFACFRCSRSAEMSSDFTRLKCRGCDLSWEAGVLGYELVGKQVAKSKTTQASIESHEQYDDFGTAERERLAGLWDDDE
ncbi:hypothetical protein CKM354_000027200 [Cercospora kikuchii]|uniref:Myb-like domain-containing protein n=1 Tax=Cercospora kikuchii TaxID=84275 RepID=A0A9P3CAZ9_9PEZI|nr:uncharacterized protein CKM354_000027200 [Cercospora kikuchii]GIZ36805.1 hypothetical protein CKM354_000027200 [Cercospora kikuchii]